jgi:hypothetical protein
MGGKLSTLTLLHAPLDVGMMEGAFFVGRGELIEGVVEHWVCLLVHLPEISICHRAISSQ